MEPPSSLLGGTYVHTTNPRTNLHCCSIFLCSSFMFCILLLFMESKYFFFSILFISADVSDNNCMLRVASNMGIKAVVSIGCFDLQEWACFD